MKRLPYLLMVLLVLACSSVDCPVNSLVETKYEVYGSDGETLKLTDTLTVISIRADDSLTVLNSLTGASSFHLPISYSHPEDILYFVFHNRKDSLFVVDTVCIKKDDYPHFESVDCNASFFHTLTDVRYTKNYIDSLVIKNPSVTYDSKTVHFYLYPKSGD